MAESLPRTIRDAQPAALDPPPGPVTASLHTGGASGERAATVYIVTTTDDNHHIEGVFSDEAVARAYAAHIGFAAVEAHEVETRMPEQRTVYQFEQVLTSPATLEPPKARALALIRTNDFGVPHVQVWPEDPEDAVASADFWRQPRARVRVVAWSTDRALALKALHDRMAPIQAKAAGL